MIKCKAVHEVVGKTAYLGDEYSYSYAAAERLSRGEYVAFSNMSQALAAVGKTCEYAVVPVENNVEGAVNEVYDALFDSGLYILRQLILPVKHSLIAKAGRELKDIKRVTSHPQAIAQCRRFLDGLGVQVIAAQSTSAALKAVTDDTAAIAFRPRSGQCVLEKGIQDSALNATRFALLGRAGVDTGGTVSVSFDLKNEPGALLAVLKTIYDRGVNLTRILSRPHRDGSGKYRFFIDFDYEKSKGELDELTDGIKRSCTAFRFLGRYDCATADEL